MIACGALLVLTSANHPRWSGDDGFPPGVLTADGAGGAGAAGATALTLVVLAAAGLSLLLRGHSRTLLGLLVLLAGLAVVVVDVRTGAPTRAAALAVPSGGGGPHRSTWFWLTLVGGVLVAVGGALVGALGRRWPATRRDYRPSGPPTTRRRDPWNMLDRGEDPTL